MRNRVPVPASERTPLPEFAPVPRKFRHDGWTPERQKAFIEALADCGSVRRAAAMVNMSNENAYALRRAPGAESFRRAWEAALDFAVLRLKDVAFERAIEGQLHPVFKDGKLMGFSRRTNDALLMFCLRHYGQDANGRRVTVNYFSTRATAGVVQGGVGQDEGAPPPPSVVPLPQQAGGGLLASEASTTTVRTVINGSGVERGLDDAAEVLNGFEGVALDAEAQAAIRSALEACAARARAVGDGSGEDEREALADDPAVPFVREPTGWAWRGELLPPAIAEEFVPFSESEAHWVQAGAEVCEYYAEIAEKAGMLAPPDEAAPRSPPLSRDRPNPARLPRNSRGRGR